MIKFFAYSISHDVTSPAAGLYALTKRLQDKCGSGLDEKDRAYCDQILKTAKHIVALVEDINAYIVTNERRNDFENDQKNLISCGFVGCLPSNRFMGCHGD